MYTTKNFKSKKDLKTAIAGGERIGIFTPGLGTAPANGTVYLEGPHYPLPHKWYAQATVVNGIVTKVKWFNSGERIPITLKRYGKHLKFNTRLLSSNLIEWLKKGKDNTMAFIAPEFASVEAFIQFCFDDDKATFMPGDAQKIAANIRRPMPEVIAALKDYGLKCTLNPSQKDIRGCTSNPNGTFPFSGANSTHTTSGGSNIQGFAGRSGS